MRVSINLERLDSGPVKVGEYFTYDSYKLPADFKALVRISNAMDTRASDNCRARGTTFWRVVGLKSTYENLNSLIKPDLDYDP
jgi:hypothetical protein